MRVIADLGELSTLVDEEIAVGDWFLLDQERVTNFAEATLDRQWIHLDPERALRESPFKGTIAHGFLTLALLPYLLHQALRIEGLRLIVNYGLNRVRFPGPVRVGTRVRARVKLAGYTPIPGGAQIEWMVMVEREGEMKAGCVASLLLRLFT
jgi:acyl dehydratase